jgi:hypothetical protein
MSLLQNSNAISAGGYDINNSLRFRSSASAYLNRTPASAGNRKTWTWSCWVKRGNSGAIQAIFDADNASGGGDEIRFNANNTFTYFINGAATGALTTTQVFRDPSAWYHIVLAVDTTQATAANRATLYINGSQVTAFSTATYPTQNADTDTNTATSHRIGFTRSSQTFDGYMAESHFIDGQALTPSSFGETDAVTGSWVAKKYTGTYGINGFYLPFSDPSLNTQNLLTYSEDATNAAWTKVNITATSNTIAAPNGTTTADSILETTANSLHVLLPTASTAVAASTVYTASVYVKSINNQFIQLVFDDAVTINGGYANYDLVNGTVTSSTNYGTATGLATSITSVGSGWYRITLSTTIGANTSARYAINAIQSGSSGIFPNYPGNASNGYYVWGMQLNQGSTVSPYVYTAATAQSTMVNNLGRDYSVTTGGYNNWIPNNISVTAGTTYDAMIDSPTLTSATVANYSTLNPLKFAGTLSNANLNLTATAASWQNASSTLFVNSGKWYFEATVITRAATFGCMIGIGTPDSSISTTYGSGDTFTYLSDGTKYGSGSFGGAYGASFIAGDIIGVAFDCDARTITFYKNNVSQGTAFSNLVAGSFYGAWLGVHTSASSIALNCGQRPFAYTPPTGHKALNTYNLPDSTIKKGNTVMDATTYTGNGSTQTITNAGAFKPDFLWIKTRSAVSDHFAFNSVAGSNKYLIPNSPGAETTAALITSFNSNGFSLSSDNGVNLNAATFVGWQWQAGQGTNTTNTQGSITSTVSVNATAGFSIATFNAGATGAQTFGHGLGVAPKMVILKDRANAVLWNIYHASVITNVNSYLAFGTSAVATNTGNWGSTLPTSTVVGFGSNVAVTANANCIAYCWAEIEGFSKFGSYTGNGLADGPFVYTGFRPKFIMIKNASAVQNWIMYDTSRNTFNVMPNILYPNLTNAEATGNAVVDALSNGFKLRNTFADHNGSGNTIIYAAFAENPFKNANAR